MMIKWFDQAKSPRHHQMKAMGKPRVAREMNILQTSKFLLFLATEEPHVRPCEVVQGLKISWFWLFSAVWNLLLGGQPLKQCCVLRMVSQCLQKGHWKGHCIYSSARPSWRMRNRPLGLPLHWFNSWWLLYTKHVPTSKFRVARELNADSRESISVPQSWCCVDSPHQARSKWKPG